MSILWKQFTQMLLDIGRGTTNKTWPFLFDYLLEKFYVHFVKSLEQKGNRIGQDHSEVSHDIFLFLFLEFSDKVKRSKITPKFIFWLYYLCFVQ